MLSIIISSYQENFYNALVQNIEKTCGVEYEIIQIKNPGLMGISKAYNQGALKAKYKNFLFLHEDVLFHTENWGQKLINHLNIEKTGIIGVAGSNYVPGVPCGWYVRDMKYQYICLIQNTKDGHCPTTLNSMTEKKHLVYGVDGVFIALKKIVFNQFLFDEKLTGFHGYDLDISLSTAKKYNNYVISDILLEHFSLGGADKKCFDANIYVRKKQGSAYQKNIDTTIELERFENFIFSYFRFHGINIKNALKTLPFFPFGNIGFKKYPKIIKWYLRYFKYKKYYTDKFENK